MSTRQLPDYKTISSSLNAFENEYWMWAVYRISWLPSFQRVYRVNLQITAKCRKETATKTINVEVCIWSRSPNGNDFWITTLPQEIADCRVVSKGGFATLSGFNKFSKRILKRYLLVVVRDSKKCADICFSASSFAFMVFSLSVFHFCFVLCSPLASALLAICNH